MSGNVNNKPEVFKMDGEPKKVQIELPDDVIQLYPASEGEYQHAMKMKNDAETLIKIRKQGEALGLYGKELKKYVSENSGELVQRTHLSEAKPTATVIYSNQNTEETTISNDEVITKTKEYLDSIPDNDEDDSEENEAWLQKISEKQIDAPYELVKIPSLGRQYRLKDGEYIKMAFMNGSDENILTNSNILKSGRFLEILFSRKILSNIKYSDLIPADRDALMLWLRGTAYGNQYPIQVTDPRDTDPTIEARIYDVNIDLSELPITYLKLKPNANKNFEYTTSFGNVIEFRYLTVGQLESFQKMVLKKFEEFGDKYTETMSDFLTELIVSYNGITDKEVIKKHVNYMRSLELKEFRTFMSENDFGVDFKLKIETIGGVVETNFPINAEFFWAS